MCKTGSTTKGAKSARTPNPTALCARACRFLYHPSALVSSLWSLVSGLWSWVLGPGSWGWSWGRSNCCFLKATTPNFSGRLGLSRAESHNFFPTAFSVFSRTSSWTPSGRQKSPRGSQNRSENRPKIVPDSLRRRGRKEALKLDRFGVDVSLIFH